MCFSLVHCFSTYSTVGRNERVKNSVFRGLKNFVIVYGEVCCC